MTNTTIFIAIALGSAVGVFAWIMSLRMKRRGTEIDELTRLERMKFILIAVLGAVLIGLSVVVNSISNDIHHLQNHLP